jgi:hypothetical protein
MTGRTDNIDEYSISYTPNSPPSIGLYSAGKNVGKLVFKPNSEVLPPVEGTPITLYYHLEDFQNIIDILRNEKPVMLLSGYVMSSPTTIKYFGYIFTGNEPVGEGEQ